MKTQRVNSDPHLDHILRLVPIISKRFSPYTAKAKYCQLLREIRDGGLPLCAKTTAEKLVSCQRRLAQSAIDRHSNRGVEIKEHQFPVSMDDIVEAVASLHEEIREKGLLMQEEGSQQPQPRLFYREYHLVLRLATLVLFSGLWVIPNVEQMTRVEWDEQNECLAVDGEPLRPSPYRHRLPFDFQSVIDILRRNSGCSFLLSADKLSPMSELALQHTLRRAFRPSIQGVTARRLENAFWAEIVTDDLVFKVCPSE